MTPQVLNVSGEKTQGVESGFVYKCVSGTMLLFVVNPEGRRLPVGDFSEGEVVMGADRVPGESHLLIAGTQGTIVEVHASSQFIENSGTEAISHWFYRVGEIALAGRWVQKVIAPNGEKLRLAPGENVVTRSDSVPAHNKEILGWLKVTSGTATYCGWASGHIGVLDVAVPITRGVWLTSGLRCQILDAAAPQNPQEWVAASDLMGGLLCAAIIDSQRTRDEKRQSAVQEADFVMSQSVQAGIDSLAGAVIGEVNSQEIPRGRDYAALTCGFRVAQATGLTLTDGAWDSAMIEVATGRNPISIVASHAAARSRDVTLEAGWWELEGPPLVAKSERGDYFALIWQGRKWEAFTSAEPHKAIAVDSEFASGLSRSATEIVPILPPEPSGLSALIRLASARSRSDLVTLVVLTVGIAAMAFFTPYILGQLANSISEVTPTSIFTAVGALILILLATTGWEIVRSLALLRIRIRGSAIAIGAVWDRMMRQRATWHDKFTLGERMTQSTAVSTSATAVPDATIIALIDTVTIIGGLAAIATTSSALLLSITILLVIQFSVNLWFTKLGAKLTYERVSASSAATGRLMETLGAVDRIKVSGAQGRAFKRWASVQALLTSADLSLRKLMVIQGIVLAAWPIIGLIVIVAVSGATGASFGDFVTAQTATAIATTTLGATSMAASALLNGQAVLRKVKPVLESEPEGFGQGVSPGRISGGVSFSDINFRYDPATKPVLNGISFTVNPGEHVAIVGPSGCGKTTLMRILLGLEEPESGVISVDGMDMASLDRPSLRRQIGSVLQSSKLLPGTIFANIDMGRGLSREQVWEALEWASVATDVRAMGLGLDTPVVDGSGSVSGGQRQRILLARALASNPRMLVLDEATSALDNVTQGVIVDFLDTLRLTRIVVAHRLSTIAGADRIIVLVDGHVAQMGTYEELTRIPGHFKDLAERQLA
ncbi:MAG: ATP-binding cassette domain-containing protein [Actinomycetia bacterium]|nr:ATP-binding cassette domain-containing protein [Actinomycetes bacterium]